MKLRLALDTGSNSIGWCLLMLDNDGNPVGVADIGVSIFSDGRDPQTSASLAVERREGRGPRRRLERNKRRKYKLLNALVTMGLMPEEQTKRQDLVTRNPYDLRKRAVSETLSPFELGRALFHLGKRRGFLSNRKQDQNKDDKKKEKETGTQKQRIEKLRQVLTEGTLGSFLADRLAAGDPVRIKPYIDDIYTSRDMYRDEFAAIRATQGPHHGLSEQQWESLREIIFTQRPLKPGIRGKCRFIPVQPRAYMALPSAQNFRIIQKLRDLYFLDTDRIKHPLTDEQVMLLFAAFQKQKNVSFNKMRSLLKLGGAIRFNFETDTCDKLPGNETACTLRHEAYFGPAWDRFSQEEQDDIVDFLIRASDDDIRQRARTVWKLAEEQAEKLAANGFSEDKTSSLSLAALQKLLPFMMEEKMDYTRACRACGWHHSDENDGEVIMPLPYYGMVVPDSVVDFYGKDRPQIACSEDERTYGKIANPTVHIVLNQIRHLVNALAEKHGPIDEIHIELARDLKMNKERKEALEKENRKNKKRNEDARTEFGERLSRDDLLRIRLWKELGQPACCIYSGTKISREMVLSDQVNIEHILPFARTLDNSPANLTLSMAWANRAKGNMTPHEAFGTNQVKKCDWEEILKRADALPSNKKWRFYPGAMEEFEKNRSFLDRQLTDTAHSSKVARKYLIKAVGDPARVLALPGKMTALVRDRLGLNGLLSSDNRKNRFDHRHHAIDAFVIGICDRRLLQKISTLNADGEKNRIFVPEPWPGFRNQLREHLSKIAVYHRPDHGVEGKFFAETAYGLLKEGRRKEEESYNAVKREPVEGLSIKKIAQIRDPLIRKDLQERTAGLDGDALKKELAKFATETKIRRVRLLVRDKSLVPIPSAPFKAYAPLDVLYADLWTIPDKKAGRRFVGEFVRLYHANIKDRPYRLVEEETGVYLRDYSTEKQGDKRPHPAARHIEAIYKRDLVRIELDGEEKIMRVIQIEPSGKRFILGEHKESGEWKKRQKDENDPFRVVFASLSKLAEMKFRKIRVSRTGEVIDPGFRA